MSKAQLDFLERRLIEKAAEASVDLYNNTQGNKSYIDKLSKFSAISLLNKVENVLSGVANIDLFSCEDNDLNKDIQSVPQSKNKISVLLGETLYTGKSYSLVFQQILSNLVQSSE